MGEVLLAQSYRNPPSEGINVGTVVMNTAMLLHTHTHTPSLKWFHVTLQGAKDRLQREVDELCPEGLQSRQVSASFVLILLFRLTLVLTMRRYSFRVQVSIWLGTPQQYDSPFSTPIVLSHEPSLRGTSRREVGC